MWQTVFAAFQTDPVWGLYTDSPAREAAALLEGRSLAACIDSLEIIRVSGADAETFLQGQTTCDFKEVAAGRWQLGAHCNAKGRIQASFRALPLENDFLLLVPRGQGEPTRAALAKYALFSKVTLTLESHWLPLALLGPDAAGWCSGLFGAAPAANDCLALEKGLIAGLRDNAWLLLLSPEQAAEALSQLQASAIPLAGDNAWWLAEIQAGIAQIPEQLSEQWIPQEVNYDLVGGVNFKKGCYKGQEIVARIHYRGQTKVRTRIVQIEGVEQAAPGTRIVSVSGQNLGTLLQSACVKKRTLMGLAVLKTDCSESETLQLEPNDGSQIRLMPMPYAINNE